MLKKGEFWKSAQNQRKVFDEIAKEIGIKTWTDWYQVVPDRILESGGGNILSANKNSLVLSLLSIYPEYSWEEWKFTKEKVPGSRAYFPLFICRGILARQKEPATVYGIAWKAPSILILGGLVSSRSTS